MIEAFNDESLVRAALSFEAALAEAQAAEGLFELEYAAAISKACRLGGLDVEALAEAAAHAGTLALPLVADLRARVAVIDARAAKYVHFCSTSQDLGDTALMLQSKAAVELIDHDLAILRQDLAALAFKHSGTPMIGRTLLQPALPTTFGLKAAMWLSGVDGAAARLTGEARRALSLQFGGACGTRAGLMGRGAAIARRMALGLDLADPLVHWQSNRERIAGLGAALAILVGALGKIARDIALMSQGEVAEASEPRVAGRGGSSAMSHKHNPTGCQVVLSAALRTPGLAGTLMTALQGEHERSLGGWQAEGPVLEELFLLTHGALSALLPVVRGLDIDSDAMMRNLQAADVGGDTGEASDMAAAALAASSFD